ncbi:MAG: hypothetical protein M1375_03435 [Candidatus Thermoplasmatota archaeon]|nr:hypothetical protein [Candidatus Thermoplasmatota archaeon]MCL5791005.1 hypothetical protein [Candidatus Thermoplasmatota archaeon]
MRRDSYIAVTFLMIGVIAILASATYSPEVESYQSKPLPNGLSERADQILTYNEENATRYFWDCVNPQNGLIRDHSESSSPSSISAVGFGMTSLIIGYENGWFTRSEVYERILVTLNYFNNTTENHGFYYHFINMYNGTSAYGSGFSSIDTTLFISGALFAGQFFNGTPVQRLADQLYDRINWQWMTNNTSLLNMCYYPDSGFSHYYWTDYSEALLMYILAAGSPSHALPLSDWEYWISTWRENGQGGLRHWASSDESMFTYLYAQAYINFKNLDFNYIGNMWNNSRRAIEYDISFSQGCTKYETFDQGYWGISASNGPDGYKAYGAYSGGTDGTVAPYAMIGAIPFTPNESKLAILKMWDMKNETYSIYGFVDAFNLGDNWFSPVYIGIDVGIEILLTQDYFNGMVWKYFMQISYVKDALTNLGV